MKIQDPTEPYSGVVPRRRSARASTIGEQFRLGVHGLDCSGNRTSTDRSAVVGASAWALKAERVEETVSTIGLVSGLLVDDGFGVCPIAANRRDQPRPSLVVWVCGDETQADEFEQLAEIGAPGISIGSCVYGLDEWAFLDSIEVRARNTFIRRFVEELRNILGETTSP